MDDISPDPKGRLRGVLATVFLVAVGSLLASAAMFYLNLFYWGLGGLVLFYAAFLAFAIIWLVLLARRRLSQGDVIMALVLGITYWLFHYIGDFVSS